MSIIFILPSFAQSLTSVPNHFLSLDSSSPFRLNDDTTFIECMMILARLIESPTAKLGDLRDRFWNMMRRRHKLLPKLGRWGTTHHWLQVALKEDTRNTLSMTLYAQARCESHGVSSYIVNINTMYLMEKPGGRVGTQTAVNNCLSAFRVNGNWRSCPDCETPRNVSITRAVNPLVLFLQHPPSIVQEQSLVVNGATYRLRSVYVFLTCPFSLPSAYLFLSFQDSISFFFYSFSFFDPLRISLSQDGHYSTLFSDRNLNWFLYDNYAKRSVQPSPTSISRNSFYSIYE